MEFRYFDFREHLSRLDMVALVYADRFQIAGDFGVQRGLVKADQVAGQLDRLSNDPALWFYHQHPDIRRVRGFRCAPIAAAREPNDRKREAGRASSRAPHWPAS